MTTQDSAEIRDLTSGEIEQASGAAKVTVGPVRIKVGEDGLYFGLSIDGVGSFCIDSGGIWGDFGDKEYSLP